MADIPYSLYDAVRLRRMAERCRDLARRTLVVDVADELHELAADLEQMAEEKERGDSAQE
jgi:CRP-like cAMP-binding protein